jgi:hypothetical protein
MPKLRFSLITLGALVLVGASPAQELEAKFENRILTPEITAPHSATLSFSIPPVTPDQMSDLVTHLEKETTYSFTPDRPPDAEPNSDRPLCKVVQSQVSSDPMIGNFVRLWIDCGGDKTKGDLVVIQPDASTKWKVVLEDASGEAFESFRFTGGRDWEVPRFRESLKFGVGEGGVSVTFSGSGMLGNVSNQERSWVSTLSISGSLPIGEPTDVSDADGADRDASEAIADAFLAGLNFSRYYKGGKLLKFGVKGRATGSFEGIELVGYVQPISGWFDVVRGFYGFEIEAGYREGNAEFENLTTISPDRGTEASWRSPRMGT